VTRVSPAEAESPATSVATGAGAGATTSVPAATTSTHDRRVHLLVATTAGLFLVAVLQTAYLRRKAATESATWAPEQPEPLVPPPPVRTWGGGVRLIDGAPADDPGDGGDDTAFTGVVDEDEWQGDDTVAAGPDVAVPDILEDGWPSRTTPAPVPAPPPLRPAPRVPLEELSFWDLFPEDLPASRRPGVLDDADWALEDRDVLVGPTPEATPPPPPPPPAAPAAPGPPVPARWAEAEPAAEPSRPSDPGPDPAGADDDDVHDDLLLTELLDLSPAATQAANAAHYGNLIGAGGGDVDAGYGDDDAAWDTGADEGEDTGPHATAAASGSEPGSGSSPAKHKRSKRGGRRRPKPGGGPGGTGGGPGTGGGAGGGPGGGPGGGAGGSGGGTGRSGGGTGGSGGGSGGQGGGGAAGGLGGGA
jgi:hypothetical protein